MRKDLCNNCGKCCEFIPVDFINKIIFRDGVQPLTSEFASILEPIEAKENTTICKCKFYKDKICKNPNKPVECEQFPSSPFAFLPEGCGLEGEFFTLSEKTKQKIRKLKEEIIHYEALISVTSSKSEREQYAKIIKSHNAYIDKFATYGSKDW